MKSLLPRLLLLSALSSPGVAAAVAAENSLGQFDAHGDIGAPKLAGSASFDPVSQEYLLSAAGTNMWATRDEFHFVWK